MRDHLQGLHDKQIITPSSSPWASPIVLVRKKHGKLRMCVDYRAVNLKIMKDAYPLPKVDDLLDALGASQLFLTIDIARSYFQVAMVPKYQEKTAFTKQFGLYVFQRIQMSLANSSDTFQRLMQCSMSDMIFRLFLIYLIDILIYSSEFSSHILK